MSWLRPYGMLNELDQANLEAGRKARRRVSIVAISTVMILVVIIVGAVLVTNNSNDGSSADDRSSPSPSHFSASIKAVCDKTLYPASCFATLSNSSVTTDGSGLDPIRLFHRSVQVAKDELSKASKHLQEIGAAIADDKMSQDALSGCNELVGLAVDQLDDCISTPVDLSSPEIVDDLKTWLSASITYQHTCIDGFDNSTLMELKNKVADALNSSAELTSNSLAILTEFADFLSSIKLPQRRLMAAPTTTTTTTTDGSPSWFPSHEERRFLKSFIDPRKNANIVITKDGSGKYKTIKAALAAVPAKSNKRFVIYVKKGIYYENVRVEKDKWNVMFVGDGMDATIVSADLNFVDGTPTFKSATFAVFGKGFMARDMGFRNTAGAAKQQAVAVMSDSDHSVFYRCKFDAYQDTLYAHSLRQFYRECDIYGTVDFIFGNGAAVLQGCNILPRVPMTGQQDTITAQGKVDPNQNTGIVIHNCTIWPFGNLNSVRVYLGRPWKPYSTTVFMKTMMDGFIDPAGWMPWTGDSAPDTIFYSEYQNFGPGSATKNRVKWKGLRTMNSTQATKFTVRHFIEGNSWISKAGAPFNSGV